MGGVESTEFKRVRPVNFQGGPAAESGRGGLVDPNITVGGPKHNRKIEHDNMYTVHYRAISITTS